MRGLGHRHRGYSSAIIMKKGTTQKARSLSHRMIALFIVILMASTIAIGAISYSLNRDASIRLNGEKALSIVSVIASSIDAEAFSKIVSTGEKTDYWYTTKAFLDEVITENELVYLYILYKYDAENVYYFAEGKIEGDTVESLDLHETEEVHIYDEKLPSVFEGETLVSSQIYSSDDWGYVISGMAPITNAKGDVIGIVGADISVNELLESSQWFGFMLLLLIIGICVVVGFLIALYLRKTIGRPIAELTEVSTKIALGEPNVEIKTRSDTEIGVLADSFRNMIATINSQAEALKSIAKGDLSVSIVPKSDQDVMGHALQDTLEQLNAMLGKINKLTAQVAAESSQMNTSAQALARGATSQASAVEQLSSSVSEIAIQTRLNADLADKSAKLANSMRADATAGFEQMEALIIAVQEINKASNDIRYVLKVIDEIAFQTNILSLNASVEAARVGSQGNGFAAVSKEIQTLSKRTSESAKETAARIADTLQKTNQGVKLAKEAHEAMNKVVKNILESDRVAGEIALSSREQMTAIEQVNQGINQVASVVHQNSSVAEDSAMVSGEMHRQAEDLSGLVSRFKTKE